MAIKPAIKYPGKTNPASPAYPLGAARDITTPGDGTGTPLQKDWVNDIWGFLQAVLAEGGVTASGSPDTAQVSQYLAGLKSHSARYYASRGLLVANTSAQYANGQTIEVAGVKWTVGTGTANGMDILQLPGGKVAVYAPDRGVVYAAALGYGGSDSTAVFNRCLELGQTIVLPVGVATTLQPVIIPDGYSVITDTPGTITQINISGTGGVGTFKLDGVNITLRDLRFNGAGRAIGATAPISNFKASGLEFVGCLRSIWFGAHTSGVQLDSITMTNCAEGIEGSDIEGMVVTRLTANADSVGGNFAVRAAISGGYIQWNGHNTRVAVSSGSSVALVPGVLEADSVLNVLTVAAGASVQVLCPPVLAGSAAVDISVGATANGFIGGAYQIEHASDALITAPTVALTGASGAYRMWLSALEAQLTHSSGKGVHVDASGTDLRGDVRISGPGSFVWVGSTAPATPTSAGASGQVVMSGAYIYRCIADNYWVRYSGATW